MAAQKAAQKADQPTVGRKRAVAGRDCSAAAIESDQYRETRVTGIPIVRVIFGAVFLLLAVAVVGLLATRQLKTVEQSTLNPPTVASPVQGSSATVAHGTGSAVAATRTPPGSPRNIEAKVADEVNSSVQLNEARMKEADQ